MGKIDISEWKEFRVGDLFDIHPTKAYKCTNAELLDGGGTNVVVNSAYDNGIGGTSTFSPTENGNMITFSDTVDANTIFYQKSQFIGYPHVQGLYPVGKYQNAWTQGSLQYFVTSFRERALAVGFDYGNKFRRDIAANLFVKLPATPDGAPDWAYMESYMANLETKVAESLTLLLAAKDAEKKKVDTREWGEFRVGELFDAERGKVKNIQPLTPGATPIIAAGAYNQGIAGMYAIDSAYKNRITVSCNGAGCGSTFYHPYEFNVNGDAITLIEKKCMSDRAKQFVACILNATFTRKFSYEEKCSPQKALAEAMRLPIDKTGQPDWAYMEEYMRKVKERVKVTMEKYEMTVNEVAL